MRDESLAVEVGPLVVVETRCYTRHTRDEGLEQGPEANGLKGSIEPAGRDAIIRLVGRNVVGAMVQDGQDNVQTLEHGDGR